MMIKVRYRDITAEETQAAHPKMKPAPRDEWQEHMRGREIDIHTPASETWTQHFNCGLHWCAIEKRPGILGDAVCAHIAEIGD